MKLILNNNYFYPASELSSIKQEICQRNHCIMSEEEAEDFVMKLRADRLYDRNNNAGMLGVLLWAAKNNDNELHKEIAYIWKARNSIDVLRALYAEWQDNYDSDAFKHLCACILLNSRYDTEWIMQWSRWLTADKAAMTAAGSAASDCRNKGIPLEEWANEKKLSVQSRLFTKIKELFYCFCSAELFNCADEDMLIYIKNMTYFQKQKLIRNMIKCFLISENEEIRNAFILRYNASVRALCSALEGDKSAAYVSECLGNDKIEVYI